MELKRLMVGFEFMLNISRSINVGIKLYLSNILVARICLYTYIIVPLSLVMDINLLIESMYFTSNVTYSQNNIWISRIYLYAPVQGIETR